MTHTEREKKRRRKRRVVGGITQNLLLSIFLFSQSIIIPISNGPQLCWPGLKSLQNTMMFVIASHTILYVTCLYQPVLSTGARSKLTTKRGFFGLLSPWCYSNYGNYWHCNLSNPKYRSSNRLWFDITNHIYSIKEKDGVELIPLNSASLSFANESPKYCSF